MSDPFIGEIRIFTGNYAPYGWAMCNGQVLPIVQNTALFSLLGTTYGGDGKTTFALPNLQGRAPMARGQGPGLTRRDLGEVNGVETVTLSAAQMPGHTHVPQSYGGVGTQASTEAAVWGNISRSGSPAYVSGPADAPMNAAVISPEGGGQSHNNRQPFLGVNFIIALQGVFPSRS